MGIVLKIIGSLLIIGGLYGLFITIPMLLFNLQIDQINPLVIFGFVEPSATPQIFDLLLSVFLVGIGAIMVTRNGKEKPRLRRF